MRVLDWKNAQVGDRAGWRKSIAAVAVYETPERNRRVVLAWIEGRHGRQSVQMADYVILGDEYGSNEITVLKLDPLVDVMQFRLDRTACDALERVRSQGLAASNCPRRGFLAEIFDPDDDFRRTIILFDENELPRLAFAGEEDDCDQDYEDEDEDEE